MQQSCANVMLVLISILVIIITFISVWTYFKLICGLCKFSGHLVGKVVIVTGANSGIGFETAKDLAQRGACVILGCRNIEKGETAKEKIITCSGNKNIHLLKLDLESLTSVRAFVANVSQLTDRLDILINNAGQYGTEKKMTDDGLLLGMQINYFGPFLLTCLLLPLLVKSAPSRIINVSSMLYKYGVVNLDDLNMKNERNRLLFKHKVYFNAKLCTMLMTTDLERRLKNTGVTANALHPGAVNTQISNQVNMYIRVSQDIREIFFSRN